MQNLSRLLVSGITHMTISLCLIHSAHAATVNPEEADDTAIEETGGTWDAAGESSAEAWEKTKEASGDAWDATKKSSAELWEDTKEFSSDAWDATKEGSAEAWESTKEWVNGSDEESEGTDENITEDTGTEI
jgi:hypothetical protein